MSNLKTEKDLINSDIQRSLQGPLPFMAKLIFQLVSPGDVAQCELRLENACEEREWDKRKEERAQGLQSVLRPHTVTPGKLWWP